MISRQRQLEARMKQLRENISSPERLGCPGTAQRVLGEPFGSFTSRGEGLSRIRKR
jgi:hypothetical protein